MAEEAVIANIIIDIKRFKDIRYSKPNYRKIINYCNFYTLFCLKVTSKRVKIFK